MWLPLRGEALPASAGAMRATAASRIAVSGAFRKRKPGVYSSRTGVLRIDSSLKPGMWIRSG